MNDLFRNLRLLRGLPFFVLIFLLGNRLWAQYSLDEYRDYYLFLPEEQAGGVHFPKSWFEVERFFPDTLLDSAETGTRYHQGDYEHESLEIWVYPVAKKLRYGGQLFHGKYNGYNSWKRNHYQGELATENSGDFFYYEGRFSTMMQSLKSHPLPPEYQIRYRGGAARFSKEKHAPNLRHRQLFWKGSNLDKLNTNSGIHFQSSVADTFHFGEFQFGGQWLRSDAWLDSSSLSWQSWNFVAGWKNQFVGAALAGNKVFPVIGLAFSRTSFSLRLESILKEQDLALQFLLPEMENFVFEYGFSAAMGADWRQWRLALVSETRYQQEGSEVFYTLAGDSLILRLRENGMLNKSSLQISGDYRYAELYSGFAMRLFNSYLLNHYGPSLFDWQNRLILKSGFFQNHLKIKIALTHTFFLTPSPENIWFSPELLRWLPLWETDGSMRWQQMSDLAISGQIGNFRLSWELNNLLQSEIVPALNALPRTRFFRINVLWHWKN
ncbi:MAG TPA: hypothetical protein ENN84_01215 [Candidatus Marinimicrobia bacterium]|nr:hypothetical protein [Candidatus Neomarinimicrobiota bacterium]